MGVERVDYYSEDEYQQALESEQQYYQSQQEDEHPDIVPCYKCGGQMYQEGLERENNICPKCSESQKNL